MKKEYFVQKCSTSFEVDANWNKSVWRGIEPLQIGFPHWPTQTEHLPATEAKLQYDAANVYVIFRVQDRFVRAAATEIHGEVWKDSCVEFFFAPYSVEGDSYLNIEVNCCGVPLMQHHDGPRKGTHFLEAEQCRKIEIASSLQAPIEGEIAELLTWTLEYRLPFEVLSRYPEFIKPEPGVCWRANFYKCADDSSHPHWMAWSPIEQEQPDFHRPEYFGTLIFE